jgi:uncharacterized membrane-anchored protein
MKKLRLIISVLVALAQISVPAAMIWKRQHTLSEGRLWKFRTAPVDPVDAMRGRYLSLRFDAEEFSYAEPLPVGREVYVTLKEAPNGFAIVDQVSATPSAGDNVVRVEYSGFYERKMRIRFPFDQFWVSEANAAAAEQAYFGHSNRQRQDAYVGVRVTPGDAAIEELYLAGQPLREYLRANAASAP